MMLTLSATTSHLPLSPWFYELSNSLTAVMAFELLFILARFFLIETRDGGVRAAYGRMRVRLAAAIATLVFGMMLLSMWTWWGRRCANINSDCGWMVQQFWELAPWTIQALKMIGILCLIRVLIPGIWGRRAWMVALALALVWAFAWFSGRDQVVAKVMALFH
jgi:hypothetical protein